MIGIFKIAILENEKLIIIRLDVTIHLVHISRPIEIYKRHLVYFCYVKTSRGRGARGSAVERAYGR